MVTQYSSLAKVEPAAKKQEVEAQEPFPVLLPPAFPFVYACPTQSDAAKMHLAAYAMYQIVVSASPAVAPEQGKPAIQVSKDPDAVTVTVPAKKECEIVFAPFSSVIHIDEPEEGLHAKIVMTVKKDDEVQTLTYYMAEEAEHGGDDAHDPPLQPAINPHCFLQRMGPPGDLAANMRQEAVTVPWVTSFTLPKEFKRSLSGRTTNISISFPILTNARPIERGEVLILEALNAD